MICLFNFWLVGWLCLTSHRQRGHLETAIQFLCKTILESVQMSAKRYTIIVYDYRRVFEERRESCVTVRRPFVCPSVHPSVRKLCTISSYTIDARITKPLCMITLCTQMLAIATYLKFVSVFQF